MHFDNASLQIIRSVTQRGLVLHWDRLRKGRPLPTLIEFDPDKRSHEASQLSFCSVAFESGQPRYRVLHEGSQMAAAYNSNWTDRYLDDALPEHAKPAALVAFDRCRESCRIAYTVSTVRDAAGNMVDCERLLLPFGAGPLVSHIVVSLQLISIEGAFMRQNIFGDKLRPVTYSVMALVDPSPAKTSPEMDRSH